MRLLGTQRTRVLRYISFVTALTLWSIFAFAAPLSSIQPTLKFLRVGVYTGSFDPPHRMHYEVQRAALGYGLDYMLMIPNGRMSHKPNASPFADRLTMSAIGVADDPRILVPNPTGDPAEIAEIIENTMAAFALKVPNVVFVGVIGSDVADLMSGRTEGYIASQNAAWTDRIDEWYVGARGEGYVAPTVLLGRPVTRAYTEAISNMSSTYVRKSAVHSRAQLTAAVGAPVAEWIVTKPLYGSSIQCQDLFK